MDLEERIDMKLISIDTNEGAAIDKMKIAFNKLCDGIDIINNAYTFQVISHRNFCK